MVIRKKKKRVTLSFYVRAAAVSLFLCEKKKEEKEMEVASGDVGADGNCINNSSNYFCWPLSSYGANFSV